MTLATFTKIHRKNQTRKRIRNNPFCSIICLVLILCTLRKLNFYTRPTMSKSIISSTNCQHSQFMGFDWSLVPCIAQLSLFSLFTLYDNLKPFNTKVNSVALFKSKSFTYISRASWSLPNLCWYTFTFMISSYCLFSRLHPH